MAGKRRGRPKAEVKAESSPQGVAGVSQENDIQNTIVKQTNAYARLKGGVTEQWYIMYMNKLLKKTRYENGNVYSTYEGKIKTAPRTPRGRAENEALKAKIKQLQKDNLMRAI